MACCHDPPSTDRDYCEMIIKVLVLILGLWTTYSWALVVEVAGWEAVKAAGVTAVGRGFCC